jgi:uncharacterized protein YfcZ (UPF0381/DUF406 family)
MPTLDSLRHVFPQAVYQTFTPCYANFLNPYPAPKDSRKIANLYKNRDIAAFQASHNLFELADWFEKLQKECDSIYEIKADTTPLQYAQTLVNLVFLFPLVNYYLRQQCVKFLETHCPIEADSLHLENIISDKTINSELIIQHQTLYRQLQAKAAYYQANMATLDRVGSGQVTLTKQDKIIGTLFQSTTLFSDYVGRKKILPIRIKEVNNEKKRLANVNKLLKLIRKNLFEKMSEASREVLVHQDCKTVKRYGDYQLELEMIISEQNEIERKLSTYNQLIKELLEQNPFLIHPALKKENNLMTLNDIFGLWHSLEPWVQLPKWNTKLCKADTLPTPSPSRIRFAV